MNFSKKETIAYGLGAVGKDMVYALSASYVMYYYQDILGLGAAFVGFILMIARVFDAANDPLMGIIVAKTKTKWGKFRPWVLIGTILNAIVLVGLFAAPDIEGSSLRWYFSIMYILWGTTYTMMDIPYWSMIPAVTDNSKDREHLSVVGRTCAGVGNALITVGTVICVGLLGGGVEKVGFRYFAIIIAIIFVVTETILFFTIREKANDTEMKTNTIRGMFTALFKNDQAIVTVGTIILINTALYLTSNLIIYFFKYDISGIHWKGNYTLFTSVGGAAQILSMMALYPLLRKKFNNTQIFKLCLLCAILGYGLILMLCFTGLAHNMVLLCLCGLLVFGANGILTVLTTVFLSNSVDYGELITGEREESVIFSMQTFVVKLASGLAVFMTGIGLSLIHLVGNTEEGEIVAQSVETIVGLRLLMTILPIIGLFAAFFVFRKKFILTDEKADEISLELKKRHAGEETV